MEYQISSSALYWTNEGAMRSGVVAQHTGSDTAIPDHVVQYGKLDTAQCCFPMLDFEKKIPPRDVKCFLFSFSR